MKKAQDPASKAGSHGKGFELMGKEKGIRFDFGSILRWFLGEKERGNDGRKEKENIF